MISLRPTGDSRKDERVETSSMPVTRIASQPTDRGIALNLALALGFHEFKSSDWEC